MVYSLSSQSYENHSMKLYENKYFAYWLNFSLTLIFSYAASGLAESVGISSVPKLQIITVFLTKFSIQQKIKNMRIMWGPLTGSTSHRKNNSWSAKKRKDTL